MVKPNQLRDASRTAAQSLQHTTLKAVKATTDSILEIPRVVISTEERLRQKIRSSVRVAIATAFLGISSLITLGANVTVALAKKVSPDLGGRRTKEQLRNATRKELINGHRSRLLYKHSGKMHVKQGKRTAAEIASESAGTTSASSPILTSIGKHYKATGTASWYGRGFHNRRTASGVRFNTHSMMAAHRTLPFGTKVKVTNLTNHKSCIVEITDRGPFVHNRLIDLSEAAAEHLGFASIGTANVKVEVIDPIAAGPDIATGDDADMLRAPKPAFDALRQFPPSSGTSAGAAMKLQAALEQSRSIAIEADEQ